MTYYYEELVRSRRRAFGTGVLAGALVIASIWGTAWALGSSGAEDTAPPLPTAEQLAAPVTTEAPPSRVERCEEVFAAQTRLLLTIGVPVSQWQTHIGVMNKLVTGVITLPQGIQFWGQTRVEVLDALERHTSAREVFDELTARCPAPDDGNPTPRELRCSTAVAARDAEISAADTSLGSWQQHVLDMEMLRRGEITEDEASRRWLATWREDVKELTSYTAAEGAAEGQTC